MFFLKLTLKLEVSLLSEIPPNDVKILLQKILDVVDFPKLSSICVSAVES